MNLFKEKRLLHQNPVLDRGFRMSPDTTGLHNDLEVISADGEFSGPVVPRNAGVGVEIKGASFTVDAQDSGKIFKVIASITVTLPATALGINVKFLNAGAKDGDVSITLAPNANDKFVGADLTAADDKDLVNTAATSKVGDYVEVLGDGADGWFIQSIAGTWDREA